MSLNLIINSISFLAFLICVISFIKYVNEKKYIAALFFGVVSVLDAAIMLVKWAVNI
jgi:phosphatidylglycerophosphate synthase